MMDLSTSQHFLEDLLPVCLKHFEVGLILDSILKVGLLKNLEEAFFFHRSESDFFQAFLPCQDFNQGLLIFPFTGEDLSYLLENRIPHRHRLHFLLLVLEHFLVLHHRLYLIVYLNTNLIKKIYTYSGSLCKTFKEFYRVLRISVKEILRSVIL